jgi:hypothetical protein
VVLKADRVLGGNRHTKVASTGYDLFICSSPLRIRGGATNARGRDEAGRYLANAREWLTETRMQRLTSKRYLPLSRNCSVTRSTFGLLRVRLGPDSVVLRMHSDQPSFYFRVAQAELSIVVLVLSITINGQNRIKLESRPTGILSAPWTRMRPPRSHPHLLLAQIQYEMLAQHHPLQESIYAGTGLGGPGGWVGVIGPADDVDAQEITLVPR